MKRPLFLLLTIAILVPNALSTGKSVRGTIVVVGIAQDQIVIAADSLAIALDGSPNVTNDCKISTYGHDLIFASAGLRHLNGTNPSDQAWDSHDAASEAYKTISLSGITNKSVRDVASAWTERGALWFRQDIREHGGVFRLQATMKIPAIVSAVFIGRDSDGTLAGFVAKVSLQSVTRKGPSVVTTDVTRIPPPLRGVSDSVDWSAIGHSAAALSFVHPAEGPQKRKFDLWTRSVANKTQFEQVRLKAIQWVQWSIESHTPEVGGPVDAVAMDISGIDWIRRKNNCLAIE